MDAKDIRGRVESMGAGGLSAQVSSVAMPADLISMITPFVRRW